MPEMPRHQFMMYEGSPAGYLPALASMIWLNNRCLYLNSPLMVTGFAFVFIRTRRELPEEIEKRWSFVLSSATAHLLMGVLILIEYSRY